MLRRTLFPFYRQEVSLMSRNDPYTRETPESPPPGLAGELARLRLEYDERTGDISAALGRIAASEPALSGAAQWRDALSRDRQAVFSEIDGCIDMLLLMSEKVRAGQLSLNNEEVCREVAAAEERVLDALTRLQRLNTASLRTVFDLKLPSLLRALPPESAALLRTAIDRQADCAQFMSNGLQELSIKLKERNKTITHPLDENHPE